MQLERMRCRAGLLTYPEESDIVIAPLWASLSTALGSAWAWFSFCYTQMIFMGSRKESSE